MASKIKRIFSASEVCNKMDMGLCYLCDEPLTVEHKSKHKNVRILLREMEDEPEHEIEGHQPHLSLSTTAPISNKTPIPSDSTPSFPDPFSFDLPKNSDDGAKETDLEVNSAADPTSDLSEAAANTAEEAFSDHHQNPHDALVAVLVPAIVDEQKNWVSRPIPFLVRIGIPCFNFIFLGSDPVRSSSYSYRFDPLTKALSNSLPSTKRDGSSRRQLFHASSNMVEQPPPPEPPDRFAVATPFLSPFLSVTTPHPGIISYMLLPTNIQVFDKMPKSPVTVWKTITTVYIDIGPEGVLFDLFKGMPKIGSKHDNYTFNCMLNLCSLELLNYGRQVYSAGIIACVIFSIQEFLKRYKIPFVGTRASEFTTIVLDLESGSVFCPVALLLNEMKLQSLGSIVPHVYLWFSALASFSGSSASSVNLEAKTDVVKNRTMGHNYVNSLLMLSCFPQSCGHYLFPAKGSEIVWKILVCKWKNVYPIIMILGRVVTGKIMPVNTVFAEKYVLFMALDSFAEVYEGGKTVKNEFSRQIGHLFISTLVVGVGLCTTFYFLLLLITIVTITAKRAVFVYEELVLWGCRMGLVSTKRLEQQIENTGNFMVVITLNVVIYHGEIGAAAASQIENPPNLVISQMFHVPQLKICTAPVFVTTHFLPMPSLPVLKWENSMAIFHRKTIDRGRIHVAPVLLKWNTLPPKHGTWKYSSLRTRMLEGEGIVTGYFTYMVLLLLFVSSRMGGGNSNAILLYIET